MALWIALHKDLALMKNGDPLRSQSTRVSGVLGYVAPASMEANYIFQQTGSKNIGGAMLQLFGKTSVEEYTQPETAKLVREASPITFVSADDPPLWLRYRGTFGDTPFAVDAQQGQWIHHVSMGMPLKERYDALGLACELYDEAHPAPKGSEIEFLRKCFGMIAGQSLGDGL